MLLASSEMLEIFDGKERAQRWYAALLVMFGTYVQNQSGHQWRLEVPDNRILHASSNDVSSRSFYPSSFSSASVSCLEHLTKLLLCFTLNTPLALRIVDRSVTRNEDVDYQNFCACATWRASKFLWIHFLIYSMVWIGTESWLGPGMCAQLWPQPNIVKAWTLSLERVS